MKEPLPFGEWLRKQRRALDLSRQELADQAGCAEITLRRIEEGTLKPSKELASLLLEKVGIPQNELEPWVRFARGQSGSPLEQSTSESQPHTNLPASLTSFIGREKEQAEIFKLIEKYRLVTLVGSGGVGKTRLSIKAGEQVLENYADGVWLLELAPLGDTALLPQTAAALFGITLQSNISFSDLLVNYLRTKSALLILDNCEHMLDACAQLADTLLKSCPHLKILATSREPLGITGEAIYRVPSLRLPKLQQGLNTFIDFESVRLFEERATLAQFDFTLTLENALSIAQICYRLDGIPLGIELAAAKVGSFSVEQIAKQLDESFNLLTGGSRTVLPRQQTLRASIDWSWNLLTESEQTLMGQLSVFSGGWTLGAALEVCDGNVMGLTSSLVRKSLIVMNQEGRRETRYGFHEVLRQYTREKLLESTKSEIIHRSHLDFFTHWMGQVEPKLHGPEQIYWLDQIETEYDNLRAALQWATNHNAETGRQLAGSLGWFWYVRGYATEGIKWLNGLITYNTPQTEAQSVVLAFKALLSSLTGDFQSVLEFSKIVLEHRDVGNPLWISATLRGKATFTASSGGDTGLAITWAEQAIALSQGVGDEWYYGMSLFALGDVYLHGAQDLKMAEQIHEKSLVVLRGIGDKFGIAHVLLSLGFNYLRQGNYARARELETEALGLLRELNDKEGIGWALANLYDLARFQGEYERARSFAEERLSLWGNVGFALQVAWARYDLARIAILQNNMDAALSYFKNSLLFFQQNGGLKDKILCLAGPAYLLLAQGKLENATRLYGAFQNLSESEHVELEPYDRGEIQHMLDMLRDQLNESTFNRNWAEGSAMTMEQAIQFALDKTNE